MDGGYDGSEKFGAIILNHLELSISQKDWLKIFLIGMIGSGSISLLIYYLINMPLLDGLLFGVLLGGFIAFFSVVFITVLNHHILPTISKRYWLIWAIFFSFLSGFIGASFAYIISLVSQITLLEKIDSEPMVFAFIVGILTYFVGALFYSMVQMTNHTKHSENLLLQSRLTSLEIQLNPHFLFNALNSLAELIHKDTKKSELLILKLSRFLRSMMVEEALIPIDKEIANLHHYIEIENIRFGDKIKLVIDKDPAITFCMVPKFSIQLIVENSIKHGFDGIKEGAFLIEIKISQTKSHYTILIQNNGKVITKREFGIGLSNLAQRLMLLSKGSVRIDTDQTKVGYIIELPKSN